MSLNWSSLLIRIVYHKYLLLDIKKGMARTSYAFDIITKTTYQNEPTFNLPPVTHLPERDGVAIVDDNNALLIVAAEAPALIEA